MIYKRLYVLIGGRYFEVYFCSGKSKGFMLIIEIFFIYVWVID